MTALTLSLTPQQYVVVDILRKNVFYHKSNILEHKHDDSLYLGVKY